MMNMVKTNCEHKNTKSETTRRSTGLYVEVTWNVSCEDCGENIDGEVYADF